MKSTLASLAALAASVAGHGYVQTAVIGGTTYTGYNPYVDPYMNPVPERIIRAIPGNGPVTDLSLIDVQCNGWSEGGVIGSSPAPLYATAAAGSQVSLTWTDWPDSHIGPIITYMAKVPSGQSVTSWMPGNAAVWFKIDHAGLDPATNTWAAIKLIADGEVYKFTIPSQLAPGQYIIRHEIIALHSSYTYPGAQVYPSCIQVQVTGSGTVTPSGSNLVSFPGAYGSTTPGLVWPLWNPNNLQSGVAYPIPGPALYFGGGSSTSGTTTTAKASSTSSTAKSTTTSSKSSSTSTKASSSSTTSKASSSSSSSSGGTAGAYAQCGGQGWTGATVCVSGYTCTYSNAYYSQCVPS